jgi:hypothetical protein
MIHRALKKFTFQTSFFAPRYHNIYPKLDSPEHSLHMNRPFLAVVSLLIFSLTTFAQPEIWSVNSRADIMRGEARSVSVDSNGNLKPAPKLNEIYKTEQPYIFSSVADAAGNMYLGTGAEGRVYKVTPNGAGSMLTDLGELNVSALAVGKDGDIFAGTSPDGKVYRIAANGNASVYFEPKEKYIWSMAVMADGSLAVGTGESGKIYRVRTANADPAASLMFDTSEMHIVSMAADRAGNLYAGTDSSGLVLRFGSDGKPFGLLDSPLREIHELSIGADGSIYVLALGESATVTKAPEPTATPAAASNTVSVETPTLTPPTPQKSRYDLTGVKTAVYRILPDGGNDVLWSSATVTGFSIIADTNGVMLGTSDRGRIYSVKNDGNETLLLQTDANQISTMFRRGSDLFATSSNQGRLFKVGPETVADGVYESAVLDAKTTASWGNLWWSSNGNVQIETRSGNSENANETWSGWQAIRPEGSRGKANNPTARFFQWRATLRGAAASLREMNLAFAGRNIAPEITSLQVLPPNVGLLANPPMQIDPNIDTSGQPPQAFGIVVASVPPRRVYQRGARAFQWTAEDRNGDKLIYDVYFKAASDAEFKLLKENTPDSFVTLDGLAFADGKYLLRVVVKDLPSNTETAALRGELTSEEFAVDSTQPTVTAIGNVQVTGDRAKATFSATDTGSFITRAEYSINGGEWIPALPEDGISDSPSERYVVDVKLPTAGEYSITLRVFDATGNIGNARAVARR